MGIFPSRKNPHGRNRNLTRDLKISSQKLWPLDHEAGPSILCTDLDLHITSTNAGGMKTAAAKNSHTDIVLFVQHQLQYEAVCS
jgi:hypothetical protein